VRLAEEGTAEEAQVQQEPDTSRDEFYGMYS